MSSRSHYKLHDNQNNEYNNNNHMIVKIEDIEEDNQEEVKDYDL